MSGAGYRPDRLARAWQLIKGGMVERLGAQQFLVAGNVEDSYTVDLTGDPMCYCRDMENRERAIRGNCKPGALAGDRREDRTGNGRGSSEQADAPEGDTGDDGMKGALLMVVAGLALFAGGIQFGVWIERSRADYRRWTAACVAAHGIPHRDPDAVRCYRSLDTLSIPQPVSP